MSGTETPRGFGIQVLSPPNFEDLIAEVLQDDELVFQISQEEGFDRMRIEIQSRQSGEPWTFALSDFQSVLDRAIRRLHELRRAT